MEVRNCRKCRRLFNYLGGISICPICKEELEKQFYVVRDYIRENPHSTIQDVAQETGTDVRQIGDWIKEGRLVLSPDSPIIVKCEKCGAPVTKGRFCDKCNQSLTENLEALITGQEKPKTHLRDDDANGPKMRFKKF